MLKFTFGPHRGPRVTQQISVLHIEHRSQSHPHFFMRMTSQVGQVMASPFCNISWNNIESCKSNCWSVGEIFVGHSV